MWQKCISPSSPSFSHITDLNSSQSIEDHRLPIFEKIVLCLSGFTDVSQRTEINRLVTKHGGTYVKDIVRPVKVTHLLCTGEVETDKMRYARKFNKAREANIKIVWEEWFHDSIRYGGKHLLCLRICFIVFL